jgi:hypothetical protein
MAARLTDSLSADKKHLERFLKKPEEAGKTPCIIRSFSFVKFPMEICFNGGCRLYKNKIFYK